MQLILFNLNDYDVNEILLRDYFKKSPLLWDIQKLEKLSLHWLRVFCLKFKLPISGNKSKLIQRIIYFIDKREINQEKFQSSRTKFYSIGKITEQITRNKLSGEKSKYSLLLA